MATTPNYEYDPNDERLTKVDTDYQNELTDIEQAYNGAIENSDKYYDSLIQASKDNAATQTQIQNEQTQHTLDQINQQKDQAHKDYIKQQSGAYVDWQKQSSQHGVNAEQMAASGMTNTGFSESSQVSMYNTYQNRVATARASYDQAVLNYNNSMKDAQLQNSSILAEIAATAWKEQAEYLLQGFQYKNNLVIDLANKKSEASNNRWNRYLAVLNQINQENALKEDVRQFNEKLDFDTTQAELDRQHQSTENELNRNFQATQAQLERDFEAEQARINREHEFNYLNAKTDKEKELLDKQHEQALAKLKQQLENDKALLAYEYDLAKKSAVVSGSKSNSQAYADAKKEHINEKKYNQTVKPTSTTSTTSTTSAKDVLNKMISSGASKAQVTKAIDDALKAGAITKEEAAQLKKTFTPRGLTY